MSQRSACNLAHLEQFWDDSLPPEQLNLLEKHLSVCENCQGLFEEQVSHFSEISTATAWLKEQATENERESTAATKVREKRTVQSEAIADIAKRMFDRSEDPSMLGRLDEYEIVEPLGAGGMGIVFKGYDRELHRYVAIKLLAPSVSLIGSAKQRFVREAQSAASIVSPYVVPIHAVASHGEIPYLVMSYVPGVNLQELIEESGALTPLQSVRIARQVALGLAAAHERGLIHRDVKPGNILIERNGQRVMLTDFGLAQAADDASLTHSGLLAGTPNFMSPEQAKGMEVDARSDLFSLGSVLYTMLAGHPPFRAPNAYAVVKRLTEESPRPLASIQPSTPAWLSRLVMRLLEKDPNHRYASAAEIAELLAECEKHLEHPSLHSLPRELLGGRTRTRFGVAASVILALVCILLIIGWYEPWSKLANTAIDGERGGPTAPTHAMDDVPTSTRHETEELSDRNLSQPWSDEIETSESLQSIDYEIFQLEWNSR
ncbi:MAG: serine/threonine-protein kinase [Pirellula sp.]